MIQFVSALVDLVGNNLVEDHCYGIEKTRAIIEQHVAEKIDGINVICFDHKGLHQLQYSLCK